MVHTYIYESSLQSQPSSSTFPAYQSSSASSSSVPEKSSEPVTKVPPVGPNCILMHPEEDVSMVSEPPSASCVWWPDTFHIRIVWGVCNSRHCTCVTVDACTYVSL